MDILVFTTICVLVGAFAGFLGGLLGIGGGVIIVPALIVLFEMSTGFAPGAITVIAVGTSMACIMFTSASAAYTQYRAGKVRWDLFTKLTPFFVAGSFSAGLLPRRKATGTLL